LKIKKKLPTIGLKARKNPSRISLTSLEIKSKISLDLTRIRKPKIAKLMSGLTSKNKLILKML
jgi:hypothetical protein